MITCWGLQVRAFRDWLGHQVGAPGEQTWGIAWGTKLLGTVDVSKPLCCVSVAQTSCVGKQAAVTQAHLAYPQALPVATLSLS